MIAQDGKDWAIAVVVATEVPPPGTSHGFDEAQVAIARQAVCNVVRARVHDVDFPNDPVLVALAKGQFSAVCREDYWRRAMAGHWFLEHVMECLDAWRDPNPSHFAEGALWYYSPCSMDPPGSVPSWLPGKIEVAVPGLDRDFFRFYKVAP